MAQIDGKEVVLEATLITRVSLAVELVDGYTKERPIGRVRVFVKGLSPEGKLNPSGYFLFLNLANGSYTLRVESGHYRDEERAFNVPVASPKNPVLSVTLIPRPSYPFPPASTLIRGLARGAANSPAVGATVEVVGKGLTYRTDERGEFVLAFGALKENDVIKENGKRFVKGNGNTKTITLSATHPTLGNKTLDITAGVEEGKTTPAHITF